MKPNVGILYPGNMGICIAASVQNSGASVYWASEGRSAQSRKRAEQFNLRDAGALSSLCTTCTAIVSVCPPHAAEAIAEQVIAHEYKGMYLDANAISPQRTIRIGEAMTKAGVTFVDGGIIGEPAWESGKTWVYLSGDNAEAVGALFSEGPLLAQVVGKTIGKASALKMCYAAYTKGTTALLGAILSAAEALDVRTELEQQWDRDWPDFAEKSRARVRGVTAKAWRFEGEMKEIASTFRHAGLPGEFHAAAEIIYRRLAGFKDAASLPSLGEVLEVLSKE